MVFFLHINVVLQCTIWNFLQRIPVAIETSVFFTGMQLRYYETSCSILKALQPGR